MRSTLHSVNRFRSAITVLSVLLLVCALCHPATAAPRGTYVTGNLTLGTFAADIVHLSSGVPGFARPDSAVGVADLTVHNLLGPLTLQTSYRQPLFGSNYYNAHVEQFCAEVSSPLGIGTAFAHYERNPTTGFAWGMVGYRCPFRL